MAAFIFATLSRYIVLKNADIGTANLVFIIVLGGIVLLYLLIQELAEPLFSILFKRIKIRSKPAVRLPEESVLQQKIDAFCHYSDTVLSGYVADNDLTTLHECIEQYAKGQTDKVISPKMKTQGIDRFELCHYGWNLWNHFGVTRQLETAQWLINVFESLDGSDPNTLYKKFTHNERYTYKIELKDKIG